MLAIAVMVGVASMVAFVMNQGIAGVLLLAVALGLAFSGLTELNKERKAYDITVNPIKNNIFFGHPMIDDILRIIEDSGCYESISFEPETAICCRRRRFGRDDTNELYYYFKAGERKIALTLDEQYELLRLIKYYLPNGETYQIHAAYDKREYDALQRAVRMDSFYEGRGVNGVYGKELLPAQPKYYVMSTNTYRGMRFNKERRRWERPITVYSHAENEKAV